MEYSTPYIIHGNTVRVNTSYTMGSSEVQTNTYTWVNVDDVKFREKMALLEVDIAEMKITDANFNRRLQALESIDHDSFATKTQVNDLDRRVLRLENIPVGITDSQIDEIFN